MTRFILSKTEGMLALGGMFGVTNLTWCRDTIFDRTKIMNDVKTRKPWNMTYAEKERVAHEHE